MSPRPREGTWGGSACSTAGRQATPRRRPARTSSSRARSRASAPDARAARATPVAVATWATSTSSPRPRPRRNRRAPGRGRSPAAAAPGRRRCRPGGRRRPPAVALLLPPEPSPGQVLVVRHAGARLVHQHRTGGGQAGAPVAVLPRREREALVEPQGPMERGRARQVARGREPQAPCARVERRTGEVVGDRLGCRGEGVNGPAVLRRSGGSRPVVDARHQGLDPPRLGRQSSSVKHSTGPRAAAAPRFRAAAGPRPPAPRTSRACGAPATTALTAAASTEPSSTTTTS